MSTWIKCQVCHLSLLGLSAAWDIYISDKLIANDPVIRNKMLILKMPLHIERGRYRKKGLQSYTM